MSGPVNFPKKGMGAKDTRYKATVRRPPKSVKAGKINTKPKANITSKI